MPHGPTPADIAAIKSGTPRRPVPAEPGEVIYPGVGVRTCPAPPGTPTTVTLDEVLTGSDVRSWSGGGPPETELRLVTTGDHEFDGNPKGVVRRPAWVVTIRGTRAHLRGRNVPTPPPDLRGDSVVIVDALTGALLLNLQAGPGGLSITADTSR